MFIIDYKDKTPIFQQIEDQVIYFMSIGVLKKGDKLPSVRQLAQDLKINSNTVAKAYSILESKNIVYSSYKRGYFIGEGEVKEELIQEEKELFIQQVNKLKTLQVSKESLLKLVEEVYKEGN